MKKILLTLSMAATLVYAGPKLTPETKKLLNEAKIETSGIDASSANYLINKTNVVLIDVRDPNEWDKGVIKAPRVVNISRGFLEVKYPKLILKKYSKDDQFIVYCALEPRSIFAAETLQKLGFKNVKYLKGGFKNWKENDYPITK